MSDSIDAENKSELDEYGVWVKTPPHTPQDAEETAADDIGLPDFSFLDTLASTTQDEPLEDSPIPEENKESTEAPVSDDITLDDLDSFITNGAENTEKKPESSEEFAGFEEPEIKEAASEAEEASVTEDFSLDDINLDSIGDGETEISLDNFMDVSESFSDSSPTPSSSDETEISLDSFMDGSSVGDIPLDEFLDLPKDDSSSQEEIIDEEPMDIDLTFEDDVPVEADKSQEEETSHESFTESAADFSTDDIDLSSFMDESSSEEAPDEEVSAEKASQESSISADDFDDIFNSIQDESPEAKEAPAEEEASFSSDSFGESESIDLSEFGIEEDSGNQNVTIDKKQETKQTGDFDINVSVDDAAPETRNTEKTEEGDDENISIDMEEPSTSTSSATNFESSGEDFDVDSLLNSVESDDGSVSTSFFTDSDSSKNEPSQDIAFSDRENSYSTDDSPLSFTDITSEEVEDEPVKEEVKPGVIQEEKETIPDTFEEEAASLNLLDTQGDTYDGGITTSTESTETTELLKQISNEIANLKGDISNLKAEFAEFKSKGFAQTENTSGSGFFSESIDDDDTIALSGDELNNILNTAEFSSEAEIIEEPQDTSTEVPTEMFEEPGIQEKAPEEESILGAPEETFSTVEAQFEEPEESSNLSMDFSNEQLEEPNFDEVTIEEPVVSDSVIEESVVEEPSFEESSAEENEEEISVPKIDDVIVESSEQDLISEEVETASEDEFEVEAPTLESLQKPIDLFSEEKPEPLTDDNFSYLAEDADVIEQEEKATEEDENLEVGISEEPVESVFSEWQAKTEEPVAEAVVNEEESGFNEQTHEEPSEEIISEKTEALSLEEPDVEETSFTEPILEERETSVSKDIPSDMKEEIKSVLSYMDQLLESLPEEKITEFAQSEQFETYKKLFSELGLA